ncbi:mCG145996, partial [Mus musculus]
TRKPGSGERALPAPSGLCDRPCPRAHRPARPHVTWGQGPLTAIITVSSPWNLATYLSPRFTSDSLRGLKRHITLMLHSAGSAIFLEAGTAGRAPLQAAQSWGWGRSWAAHVEVRGQLSEVNSLLLQSPASRSV